MKLLATALVWAALAGSALIVVPPADAALRTQTHVDHVWINLTGQTPSLPTATDTLTLSGDVVNSTSQTVTQL